VVAPYAFLAGLYASLLRPVHWRLACACACREGASRGGEETVQAFRALARKRKAAYEEFIACMRQSSAFDLRAKVQRFCKALLEGQRYSRQETVDIVQQVSVIVGCMFCRPA
jgi:hypothetical protein